VGPWGLALRAVRDAEVAAHWRGLNPPVLRTIALSLSAATAGLAGALFAPLTTFVSRSAFPFVQSILFLPTVIIGRAGMVFGPLIGAVLIVLLPEYLSSLAEYRLLFLGTLHVGVLWMAPGGMAGTADAWSDAPSGGSGAGLRRCPGVVDMSFTACSGQITSLVGPNGVGKTTILNVLSGLYPPHDGVVAVIEGIPSCE
jgi:branched-chain amino acid transport system ATP-binding protein